MSRRVRTTTGQTEADVLRLLAWADWRPLPVSEATARHWWRSRRRAVWLTTCRGQAPALSRRFGELDLAAVRALRNTDVAALPPRRQAAAVRLLRFLLGRDQAAVAAFGGTPAGRTIGDVLSVLAADLEAFGFALAAFAAGERRALLAWEARGETTYGGAALRERQTV